MSDAATARAQVRRLVQDDSNVARLEDLSDQIPAVATPTATTFLVRFSSVPTEEYVTVFAVPGTLVAYLDGSASPTTPSSDVNANGNFTLPTAPVTSLQVTYSWHFFADTDIDDFVDRARQWLRGYATLTEVPDGLVPALVSYAAAEALRALSRKCTLANARAGDAELGLAALADAYAKQADALMKDAQDARESYWSGADARKQPAADLGHLAVDPYEPRR